MVLFNLQIPIPGENFSGFGGKWILWKFLQALGPSKGTFLRETASLNVQIVEIGPAVFDGRGDKKRTK
jgi:hypothetical protein